MAHFDSLKLQAHDMTANLFGESCSWTPLAGGAAQVGMVNFNKPDQINGLGDLHPTEWEFSKLDTWMEYRIGQFAALHDSVAEKAAETVTLTDQNGTVIGEFLVTKVMRVNDGDTYKAKLVEL